MINISDRRSADVTKTGVDSYESTADQIGPKKDTGRQDDFPRLDGTLIDGTDEANGKPRAVAIVDVLIKGL